MIMTKMYEYLVAYKFTANGFLTPCDGTMTIFRKKKVKSYEDFIDMGNFVKDSIQGFEGITNFSIYNYILIGRNKH